MKNQLTIRLDRFKPRPYQIPILDALENKGYRKIIAVLPRRAGKDLTCWNVMLRAALRRVGVYFYCLPTFSQARKVIWDNITIQGERILDYIPEELIANKNQQEMKIRLINGSIIQLIGSDTYNRSLVGTNPLGIVFSEAAQADLTAYRLGARPILAANDGWVIFNTTPRGKNDFYDLFKIAQQNPSQWFAYKMGLEDTKHLSEEAIEIERKELSEDLFEQEYNCSFELGVEGAFYAKIIDKMHLNSQIGSVPWDPSLKVHTAWDLGIGRNMSVIFFQAPTSGVIRIIDFYQRDEGGLPQYISYIKSLPYTYGKHIGPHDIRAHEIGSGMTRFETARDLGLLFTQAPDVKKMDGIERVKLTLAKTWIDDRKCAHLIKALENYKQVYDSDKKTYRPEPTHDWASHPSDAMRYLAISVNKVRDGASPEDLEKRYNEAMGYQNNMPSVFRTDLPEY